MIVAMRRSIRVGPQAGSPLEEFGVEPDQLHLMTERDILEDNRDLMACAARIIRQQPSFKLSVTPLTRKGARGVVPVRSIDARRGAVSSTQLTLGREHKKNSIVEVEARDQAGRLVAFRRTAIR